jgi:hypothetical protein
LLQQKRWIAWIAWIAWLTGTEFLLLFPTLPIGEFLFQFF